MYAVFGRAGSNKNGSLLILLMWSVYRTNLCVYCTNPRTHEIYNIITQKLPLRFIREILTHGRFELTSETKLTGPALPCSEQAGGECFQRFENP